ncbi:hypothetical protein JX266_001019 [Neoarthrinium moseri]|nr:hypothetical protein JX266_001019 [Neoarthrinium moseri]
MSNGPWNSSRSVAYSDPYQGNIYDSAYPRSSVAYPSTGTSSSYNIPISAPLYDNGGRPESSFSSSPVYTSRPLSAAYPTAQSSSSQAWDAQAGYSPTDSVDDIIASPGLSEYGLDNGAATVVSGRPKSNSKSRPQRRPSNRDEFDGPHQFLQRPPASYVAMQERELPHLPTNLLVQEQDSVLNQVNDRLSQCAYDFVAKYQFPIPLTQDMRPVERPQDREWTEWVYLLKRLATKRRIPARVLYNGQIKQFVTILENSLEMRHAAKHQSRPLKDDRNILQLISAGIQVAKILKDAAAMDYLDRLYVSTEQQIRDRSAAAQARFR